MERWKGKGIRKIEESVNIYFLKKWMSKKIIGKLEINKYIYIYRC